MMIIGNISISNVGKFQKILPGTQPNIVNFWRLEKNPQSFSIWLFGFEIQPNITLNHDWVWGHARRIIFPVTNNCNKKVLFHG
jgi:hypothetical protein